MGNGCVKPPSHCVGGNPRVRVVLSDGTVEDFEKPITVAELMMDYPQHFVCQSISTQSASLQKKSILPAIVELEPGRVYYLLPSSKFSGALSPPKTNPAHAEEEDVHKFDLTNWKGRPVAGLITRDDIGVGADSEDKDDSAVSFSTPDLRSMYSSGSQAGLLRCNSWKPRLETIHEVGALSKKKFQNFVRGRGSMSQVHNNLSS